MLYLQLRLSADAQNDRCKAALASSTPLNGTNSSTSVNGSHQLVANSKVARNSKMFKCGDLDLNWITSGSVAASNNAPTLTATSTTYSRKRAASHLNSQPHIKTSPSPNLPQLSATLVLPHLFLGDEKDAQIEQLKELKISYVLNVTSHLPAPGDENNGLTEADGIKYKRIPASDDCNQNLKPYFEDAFEFIGM